MNEINQENPPQARVECEHHWVSEHEPNHILYWVRICSQCNQPDWDDLDREIKKLLEEKKMAAEEGSFPKNMTLAGSMDNSNHFQMRARDLVYQYAKNRLDKTDDIYERFGLSDVYVVWFCRTLGNWKALLSTNLPDGMYYEVTHDGNKGCDYLDVYKKFHNVGVLSEVEPEHAFNQSHLVP